MLHSIHTFLRHCLLKVGFDITFVLFLVLQCLLHFEKEVCTESVQRVWTYQREVIRIRKSKDKQHNGQKKKNKRTNNDLQNITQISKDRITRTPLKHGVNKGGPEVKAVPDPLLAPVNLSTFIHLCSGIVWSFIETAFHSFFPHIKYQNIQNTFYLTYNFMADISSIKLHNIIIKHTT
jgi:hypothetical protein